jgi:hypothetical protein
MALVRAGVLRYNKWDRRETGTLRVGDLAPDLENRVRPAAGAGAGGAAEAGAGGESLPPPAADGGRDYCTAL